ncbi:hypothetical protein YC2023_065370 [Brassica napus]
MAYILNPYYFYKDMSIQFDWDVITAIFKCVDAFYPNDLDAQTFVINIELAINILSLTTSSLGCKRNSSTLEGETGVELGDTCETLGASSRDDLIRELDESDFESDDEEKIDMEFDLDDE